MSSPIDPNGFGDDVERALQRVEELPESADGETQREKLRRDRQAIVQYVYGVEDTLASGTLRTRISRLRGLAEQTETPLSDFESKTPLTTNLGKMSRKRGWETSETKRNYIKALKGFYRFHDKAALAEELNEFVSKNLTVPSTEAVDVKDAGVLGEYVPKKKEQLREQKSKLLGVVAEDEISPETIETAESFADVLRDDPDIAEKAELFLEELEDE